VPIWSTQQVDEASRRYPRTPARGATSEQRGGSEVPEHRPSVSHWLDERESASGQVVVRKRGANWFENMPSIGRTRNDDRI
jgi:hypothetical protein